MTKGLLRALKRTVPVLCIVCSLACLPAASLQWLKGHSGAVEGPLHISHARRCALGVLCGRGGNELREMFRIAERSRGGFLLLAGRLAGFERTHRGGAGHGATDNHQLIAARRSLLRSASGRADDDPPA